MEELFRNERKEALSKKNTSRSFALLGVSLRYSLFLFLSIYLFILSPCEAQSRQDSLDTFLNKKFQITHDGMYVLGAWSVANLGTGIYGALTTEGTSQSFHQMNALWGGVNLLISFTAIRSLNKTYNKPSNLMQAELELKKTKRLFLINSGLDVLYMGAGIGMLEWAKNQPSRHDRIKGFGNSFIMQGAFLLGFDLAMYYLHRKNGKKRLSPLLNSISFYGNGVIIRFG